MHLHVRLNSENIITGTLEPARQTCKKTKQT